SGIIVIKDSSANKAGVSCSSYEIIACLTLSPEEFAEIKPIYVEQVLSIIRKKADLEAKLLFREWDLQEKKTDLVKLSYDISAEINYGKDVLLSYLSSFTDETLQEKKYLALLFSHCPQILIEKYRDRVLERLPKAHKIAILSAFAASTLVYQKGLHMIKQMQPQEMLEHGIKETPL
ncbi:MAG: hypothetical protein K2X39_09945, partial [Silvanigrellaceae bacterium]|nr:hypothetical protein [Silvanigrellaceae bacterium]